MPDSLVCSSNALEIPISVKTINNIPHGATAIITAQLSETGGQTITKDTTIIGDSTINTSYIKQDFLFPSSGPGAHYITQDAWMVYGPDTFHIDSFAGYTGNYSYGPQLCKTISGRMFADINSNCQYDSADVVLKNRPLKKDYTKIYYTDNNGEYVISQRINTPFNFWAEEAVPGGGFYYAPACSTDVYHSGQIDADTTINFIYRDSISSIIGTEAFFQNGIADACALPANRELMTVYQAGNVSDYNVKVDFGDGSDTTVHVFGESFRFYHTYNSHGTFYPIANFIFEDTILRSPIYEPIKIYGSCGSVTGKVFNDVDLNCNFDPAVDTVLGNVMLVCRILNPKIELYTYTDSAGDYGFDVPDSVDYEIALGGTNASGVYSYGYNYGNQSCPALHQESTLSDSLNFGVACYPSQRDFVVNSSGWGFRPGFAGHITANVVNKSCTSENGTLKYVLDPKEVFESSTPSPSRINGQELEWDFTNLNSQATFNVYITFRIDSTQQIGDSVCHLAFANPLSGDANPADNEQVMCDVIRGSYDPNDKTAYLAGSSAPVSNLLPTQKDLVYRLRFQNTGTDTAFNIYLVDTIDNNLDLRTLHVISASHPMNTFVSPERVIRFEFNDILLPDDKTNEPLSHGYVNYSISLKDNLALGTQIHNTGYIYFDYNQAVVTNTTENTIRDPSSVGELGKNNFFSAYPNPANNVLTINLAAGIESGNMSMIDLLGKTAMEQSILGSISLNINHLPSGVYIIQVETEAGRGTSKLIISR